MAPGIELDGPQVIHLLDLSPLSPLSLQLYDIYSQLVYPNCTTSNSLTTVMVTDTAAKGQTTIQVWMGVPRSIGW